MRRPLATFVAALLLLPASVRSQQEEEDREPARHTARARLLDTAHALAVAEGGTGRPGPWEGWLGAGGETVLPMQLFRGQAYHLVIGIGTEADALQVDLFDGLGRRVEAETRGAAGRVIVSLTPTRSGTYYLRLRSAPERVAGAVAVTYVYR